MRRADLVSKIITDAVSGDKLGLECDALYHDGESVGSMVYSPCGKAMPFMELAARSGFQNITAVTMNHMLRAYDINDDLYAQRYEKVALMLSKLKDSIGCTPRATNIA